MNWLVVMPAWGERALYCLEKYSLPAILGAAKYSGSKVRFLVHTDRRDFVQMWLDKLGLECLIWDVQGKGVGGENQYLTVSYCYQSALATFARPGEAVLMATADMVVSCEVFAACEAQFANGKRVVMCSGLRTIEGNVPPLGVDGPALSAWGWVYRHPWIKDCVFGEGTTMIPSYVIFRDGNGSVWLNAFHLHPVALMNDARKLSFFGTIDYNIMDNWSRGEVHIVQDPAEMAIIELSPIWHCHFMRPDGRPNTVDTIAVWAYRNATKSHRWLFQHPIRLIGGEPQQSAAVGEILGRLNEPVAR